jgi:preprotein translocase subunit SecF
MATQHRFMEFIRPGTSIDFWGKRRLALGISLVLSIFTVVMLVLNAYVIPGRGQALNWGVEFKGGSEIVARFAKNIEAGQIREALEAGGYHGAEVYKYYGTIGQDHNDYMIRMGAVTPLNDQQREKAEAVLRAKKIGEASLVRFEHSEGGDKVYLRFDKAVGPPEGAPAAIIAALKEAGVVPSDVQPFGRTEDHSYEVTLLSLDTEVKEDLEAKLGKGTVSIQAVSSVGAKAGSQLTRDGIKAVLGAILLIVIYIGFRFDFRYGPGTVVGLLHDSLLTIGAFAVTYFEFSLTTLAALLTIVGYSMNDKIVLFDRIRENAGKHRDRKFEKMVNESINEVLSRTLLTGCTSFLVTLAMNIFTTGVIRDFAFAMNIGVVVGTYSSIFVSIPVLVWLNEKYLASQRKQNLRPERQARRPVRRSPDKDGQVDRVDGDDEGPGSGSRDR